MEVHSALVHGTIEAWHASRRPVKFLTPASLIDFFEEILVQAPPAITAIVDVETKFNLNLPISENLYLRLPVLMPFQIVQSCEAIRLLEVVNIHQHWHSCLHSAQCNIVDEMIESLRQYFLPLGEEAEQVAPDPVARVDLPSLALGSIVEPDCDSYRLSPNRLLDSHF